MTNAERYDIVIRNGTLIDGTGRPAVSADVAIRGDRIARVGTLRRGEADQEIDARGWIVAPGFIDVHSHDDAAVIDSPHMAPKLTQGVTTVISGNCGVSGFPYASSLDPPNLLRLVFRSSRCVASSFDTYLQKVRAAGPAINAAFLTGHTTLRIRVMGDDLQRPATAAEAGEMRELLVQSLEQGSLGLSTGLFYPPARASSTEEVVHLAQALSKYEGVYATHMRDEANGVIDSINETLHIGRAAEAPIVISHHKCLGRDNFGRSVETLALLGAARQQQRVAWDVYPYTAGSSVLNEELVSRADRTVITWSDPHPQFCGLDLEDIGQILGCSPLETVPRLQPAGATYFMMDESDVQRILRSEAAMIGSDGIPGDEHPHPRLWGTFPRILGRYVREQQVLTLEDAVYRMTGLSAKNFGLRNRGTIEPGKYADLCIFDAHSVSDVATYENPILPAVGIRHVIVNGQIAIEEGFATSARAGKALRRQDATDLPESH